MKREVQSNGDRTITVSLAPCAQSLNEESQEFLPLPEGIETPGGTVFGNVRELLIIAHPNGFVDLVARVGVKNAMLTRPGLPLVWVNTLLARLGVEPISSTELSAFARTVASPPMSPSNIVKSNPPPAKPLADQLGTIFVSPSLSEVAPAALSPIAPQPSSSPVPGLASVLKDGTHHYNPAIPILRLTQQDDALLAYAAVHHSGSVTASGNAKLVRVGSILVARAQRPITKEVLKNAQTIRDHNLEVIVENDQLLRAHLKENIVLLRVQPAIREIYKILLENFAFDLAGMKVTPEEQVAMQEKLYQDRMRADSGHSAAFGNFLAPVFRHQASLLHVFSEKLEELIGAINSDWSALLVASWAKQTLTELQPAIDGNTRAGRALFDYVIGRAIPQLKHASTALAYIDLSHEFFGQNYVSYLEDGRTFVYRLNDGTDYKLDLNRVLMIQLERFEYHSYPSGTYYMVGDPLPGTVKGKRAIKLDTAMVPFFAQFMEGDIRFMGKAPQVDFLARFMDERIRSVTPQTLSQDSKLLAETKLLINALKQGAIR